MNALKEFFDHIPAETSAAFIVLTHLRRDRHSILTDLLSPHTQLSIARIDHDVPIRPGNVYVLIENTSLTVKNGWLNVATRDEKILNSSVDIFFKSLATEFKDRARKNDGANPVERRSYFNATIHYRPRPPF